ncbi:MAG: tRNA (adenosine(37)-N6)-threonylcarbamoyltransferase complex ATPase subunit type 1 TsaE [Elusimicrobiota bacterium]
MNTFKFQTSSPLETMRLAELFARFCKGGEIFCLYGTIGTGKTVFVQGFAGALGSKDVPVSASFNLMKTYRGKLDIVHFDLFRIMEWEIANLGIEDYIDGKNSVLVIEWAKPAEHLFLSDDIIKIYISLEGGDNRDIKVRVTGPRPSEILKKVIKTWKPKP